MEPICCFYSRFFGNFFNLRRQFKLTWSIYGGNGDFISVAQTAPSQAAVVSGDFNSIHEGAVGAAIHKVDALMDVLMDGEMMFAYACIHFVTNSIFVDFENEITVYAPAEQDFFT